MPYQYEYYDLFILIGDERDNVDETLTPDSLRNKLNLSKREFNSRMGVLMSYDLVDMVNMITWSAVIMNQKSTYGKV
jgi:hypothetical protein